MKAFNSWSIMNLDLCVLKKDSKYRLIINIGHMRLYLEITQEDCIGSYTCFAWRAVYLRGNRERRRMEEATNIYWTSIMSLGSYQNDLI